MNRASRSEAFDLEAPSIHPTAIVEPSVQIGDGTAVWDSVHLRGPSTIGRQCIIGEKTYVACGVDVADRVKINAHVYVCTGVTIETAAMIAAGVVFTNDRFPRAFAGNIDELATSEPTADTLPTFVRRGVTIGARAAIGPGIEIGEFALVGMGAVVVGDVPAHGLVYGNPARLRGYVCICGLPLISLGESSAPADKAGSCQRCRRRFDFAASQSGRSSLSFTTEARAAIAS